MGVRQVLFRRRATRASDIFTGRCSIEAGHRHIDVSKVIWLGTSNVGHDLVFEHDEARANREEPMSREEYVDLIGLLRPKVSDRLGVSCVIVQQL